MKVRDYGVFKAIYRLTVYQVEGGGEKTRLERFDVIAPDDLPEDDLRRAAVKLIGKRGEGWTEVPREGIRAFVGDELEFQTQNHGVRIRVDVEKNCAIDAEITKD